MQKYKIILNSSFLILNLFVSLLQEIHNCEAYAPNNYGLWTLNDELTNLFLL